METFIAFIRRIGFLCRKELLAILKDPANRVILIAPVLVQTMMFGYGATYDLNHVPYAVLDQSRSAASTELIARFDAAGVFRHVATLRTPAEIAKVIDGSQALMVLHIAPDFAERIAAGQDAPVQLVLDGRKWWSTGIGHPHCEIAIFMGLSDPGAEEALYDIQSMRAFAGLELGRDAIELAAVAGDEELEGLPFELLHRVEQPVDLPPLHVGQHRCPSPRATPRRARAIMARTRRTLSTIAGMKA